MLKIYVELHKNIVGCTPLCPESLQKL